MKILSNPSRIYDSRSERAGQFKAGEIRTIDLGKDLKSPGAFITVTAVAPQEKGFVTVWSGGKRPTASALNYAPSTGNVANTTAVSTDGNKFSVYCSAATSLIVDVVAVQ